jgi:CheY-like chemotaxis protein
MSHTIWIIDDESSSRAISDELGSTAKMQIRTATTYLEVLELCRNIGAAPPDIIILDLTISDIDGLAVYSWLIGNGITHRTPIIVIASENSSRDSALPRPGVARTVWKERIAPGELIAIVREVQGEFVLRSG